MTRKYGASSRTPNLVFYPAARPNGHSILIIPGGGYARVVLDGEGSEAVRFFNDRGWHAWVLEYTTTANAPAPLYPTPINEALEAVRQVRAQQRQMDNSDGGGKLGVIGFSAGAHLAALLSTNNYAPGPFPAAATAETAGASSSDQQDVDFGILAYGVITMDKDSPAAHGPSRACLLGPDPSAELCRSVSPQHLVCGRTPPVFLFHTANDGVVASQNA
ncbi:Alpha/Beta hydrolase protein, partial [Microdochium bolleyi]